MTTSVNHDISSAFAQIKHTHTNTDILHMYSTNSIFMSSGCNLFSLSRPLLSLYSLQTACLIQTTQYSVCIGTKQRKAANNHIRGIGTVAASRSAGSGSINQLISLSTCDQCYILWSNSYTIFFTSNFKLSFSSLPLK